MNIAFPAPEFSHMLGNGTTHIYNYINLILNGIPRSSAAAGTNHMRTVTSVDHDSHEMPRSSAAIGSFTSGAELMTEQQKKPQL